MGICPYKQGRGDGGGGKDHLSKSFIEHLDLDERLASSFEFHLSN